MGTGMRTHRLLHVEDNVSVSCTSVIPILGIQINFLEQKWNVYKIWERQGPASAAWWTVCADLMQSVLWY
jgi:hypothetical protein